MKARTAYTDVVLLRRIMGEARPYWVHVGAIFVVSLLSAPLTLLTPVPLMIAVDSVIGSHPVPDFLDVILPTAVTDSNTALLAFVAGMFVAVAVLTAVQDLASQLLKTYTGEKLVWRFRSRLFQHIQRLSLAYHDRIGTADSTYRIQYDAMSLQYIAVESLISLITAATTLGAMLYVTYRVDPQLALVALVVSPPILFAVKIFRPRMRNQSREVKKLESSSLSIVQEVLTGLRVVKAFGQEDREQERFLGRSGEGVRARIRLAIVQGAYALLVGTIIGVGGGAVLFVGVKHVQQGTITLGDLLLVMGYLTQLYAPLKLMARKGGSLQNYLASAERAFGILDEAPDVPERAHARPLERASGRVEFRDVSFAYEPNRPVLRDVSFSVEPGERVGIAGRTGAGKSTLMSLLTRFYDPTSGAVLLDGIDLRDYKLADLRNQFGIVLQEPVLFSTSIAENIAYARPDASEAEVEEAAKAANAHDFIMQLPDGYETEVGERGMRLSGGERQRISLARAFLKNAPILILDEPTSSVDVKTEAVIMEAMERLMAGRTSFMITHRLSTLAVCERRLEIEQGRLLDVHPEEAPVTLAAASNDARSLIAPAPLGPEDDREKLDQHPAVKAWLSLYPDLEPRGVTVLRSPKRSRRAATYRLEDCGSEGVAVVAKLCSRTEAQVESAIYRNVLPSLPVPALRYQGMLDESSESCWIFVEDAGGERYSPVIDEHRRVAARWLAQLHGSAAENSSGSDLPDRGPGYYLGCLRSGQHRLMQHICDRAPRGGELRGLATLASRLDRLETRWSEVTDFCETLPRTIVHGDFVRKNLRVRASDGGMVLLAFDWERAGSGVPATDLAQLGPAERMLAASTRKSGKFTGFCADPCPVTYRLSVQGEFPDLTPETVELMTSVGNVFRCIVTIDWLTQSLGPSWTPTAALELCSRWLAGAMHAGGWNGGNGGVH
jgi:ATP-binding cassette subfamily B protein